MYVHKVMRSFGLNILKKVVVVEVVVVVVVVVVVMIVVAQLRGGAD